MLNNEIIAKCVFERRRLGLLFMPNTYLILELLGRGKHKRNVCYECLVQFCGGILQAFECIMWHGGRVVKVLASICVWTEQTQVRILLRTLFGYKARSIVTGPTRPSSLETGLYTGYQAELNIKARPGREFFGCAFNNAADPQTLWK